MTIPPRSGASAARRYAASMPDLLEINPDLDRAAFAEKFARIGRVQVSNVLTQKSAMAVRDLLENGTRWPVTWRAGSLGSYLLPDQLAKMSREELAAIEQAISEAGRRGEFCYLYWSYPLDKAFDEKWNQGSVHEQLRDELRGDAFASLLRDVTGHPEIVGADGYATHYGPRHFLARHDDQGSTWRRVVAFVLNVTFIEWNPDFGGYLTFYDEDGDVECAFRPKFNTLNLFSVPQHHSVTPVAPFAPKGRAAISGWARDTLQPPD